MSVGYPTSGCYIIGENIIHLSTEISSSTYSDDYMLSFEEACKKLETKLECLVIVDSLRNDKLQDTNAIYQLAKEYANYVYIITPIVALLQNALSSIDTATFTTSNTVIVFIASAFGVISCVLRKSKNIFYAYSITVGFDLKLKSLESTCCLYDSFVPPNTLNNLCSAFPKVVKKVFTNPLEAFVIGGLKKAQCIIEPGKHFEIINFTPGIIVGQEVVLETCKTFPVIVHYSSPSFFPHNVRTFRTIRTPINITDNKSVKALKLNDKILYLSNDNSAMNYIISYNEFGVLTVEKSIAAPFPILNLNVLFVEKFVIWSNESQQLAIYDFSKNMVQICKMMYQFENIKNKDHFDKIERIIGSFAGRYQSLTILYNEKCENKISRANVSIVPSYISLLEYCIRYFQLNNEKLIVIITTKRENKFYALSKSESGAYMVKFIGNIFESVIKNDIFCGQSNIGIIHFTETDPSTPLLFFDRSILSILKKLKASDLQAAIFQGALMYSTLHVQQARPLPYVTFNPERHPILGNPEVNTKQYSRHYEIEAVLFQLLSTINKQLFWGDLIAIIIAQKNKIYVYFFAEINQQKYLLHDYITVDVGTLLTPSILKASTNVIVLNPENVPIKFDENINPKNTNRLFVSMLECYSSEFMKMKNKNVLNICQTKKYRDIIMDSVKHGIFNKIIFEAEKLMAVEFNEDCCRLIYDKESYLAVSGDELIPMYISFSQDSVLIGKAAEDDLKNSPDAVVYDFMKLIGTDSSSKNQGNLKVDPTIKERLIAMDESEYPKLGFKIKTTKGLRVISPEMALTIFLQKLITIFEKFTNQEITKIELRRFGNKLTEAQIASLKFVETMLKREIRYMQK